MERVGAAFSMELAVKSHCASAAEQPLTAGIPLPKGLLADPTCLSLCGPDGNNVSLQALPLALWSDGTVKWLLLDFVLPPVRPGCFRYALTSGSSSTGQRASDSLSVKETANSLVVATSAATFHLSRTSLPLDQVLVGTRGVLEPGSSAIVLTDAKGGLGVPRVERVSVEARGPVRATVKYEGTFTGRVRCRFVARLCFFASTGLVRVRLTVHNPNRARHRGGLWDLGDPGSMLFRDLSVKMEVKGSGDPHVAWTAEPGEPVRSLQEGNLEIFQASSGGANWQSNNHVNSRGRVPCPFRGYRLRSQGQEVYGLRANPVVAFHGSGGTLTAAVPEFWQQFPKALEATGRELRVRLFPEQWKDLFELQGGEQKTHTVWLHFGPGGLVPESPLDWVHQPARVSAGPEWYAGSGAVPYLVPGSPDSAARLDSYLGEAVAGRNNLFARRETIDEYGWRHFGEVYADHEGAYYPGPAPVISHYNNQYDVVYGTILHYLRTGDPRWQELFDPLARHVIDIDIYHTKEDRPLYNGGLFWLTDHYKDAGTCTHRTYSRANCPADVPATYGGGPSNEHNYTTGLLHFYYLTGDSQARDAVVGLADWVNGMDDSQESVLGLLDDGPTGRASQTRYARYHGPGRGCGNSINALMDAWLVTAQRTYLDKAEELIRRSIHPGDDVPARHLLDVENKWSYTVFLSVLARYLDLKAEAGELDFMHGYARASLLAYAAWMLAHEEPYFDHPEKLDFPTETWAAQEFRKANVLRLAAAHAGEALRERLLRRAADLAERAWSDLLRFESRQVTRAIALVLVDGMRDSYFRQQSGHDKPHASEQYDFGKPENFIPQKERVLRRLKTVPGLFGALVRVAGPRSWRKLLGHMIIQWQK